MISGVEPPKYWTQTSLVLDLAILVTAAVAGVLTAGTLIQSAAGTTRLSDPRHATLAWMFCACLAGVGMAMGRRILPGTVARHKRPLILLLVLALVWTLLGVVRPTLDAGDGLVGEYFTNLTWTGSPAFSNVDTEPSAGTMKQRWNGIPPEQFSVRWTGFLTVGRSDLYTFATTSDDGSQVMVDNQLVVDNGGMHGVATRSGSIRLDRGSHVVVLRYVQFGAAAVLGWSWSHDGGDYAPVPAWALSQRPTRYATVVNARIVEWGLRSFAIVIVLATLWYLRVGLRGREAVVRWVAALGRELKKPYRNTASLVFSVFVLIVILFMPWPGSGYQLSFQAVETTARHLNSTAIRVLGSFRAFQVDINNPQTGEHVLPLRVQEMLKMLRRHGVQQYRVSVSIAEDAWGFQQIVASAWPRKLEKEARTGFVLNAEPITPGCNLIEKQREVSLVYCP